MKLNFREDKREMYHMSSVSLCRKLSAPVGPALPVLATLILPTRNGIPDRKNPDL
jgi:hypothetical protein